jgi:hypothetical protein
LVFPTDRADLFKGRESLLHFAMLVVIVSARTSAQQTLVRQVTAPHRMPFDVATSLPTMRDVMVSKSQLLLSGCFPEDWILRNLFLSQNRRLTEEKPMCRQHSKPDKVTFNGNDLSRIDGSIVCTTRSRMYSAPFFRNARLWSFLMARLAVAWYRLTSKTRLSSIREPYVLELQHLGAGYESAQKPVAVK